MAATDSDALNAALKDYYTDEEVKDTSYEEGGPLFSMMPKLEGFSGKKYIAPTQYGLPQGRSATFAKAQANKTQSYYEAFEVTMASDFATHSITRKALLESRNDRGSFFKGQTREINNMLKSLTRSAAISMFRSSSGSRGVIATSGVSGTTITLAEPEDISNFEIGQVLTLAANETTGSERVGTMTVTNVNEDDGKFTVNAMIGGASDADHIFVEGDRNAKMTGVLSWVPTSTPGATAFFGVDRTVHTSRLAGYRASHTNIPITEGIKRLLAKIGKGGGFPDKGFCSENKYKDLELELENKVIYTTTNVTKTVGFTGIKITGRKGPIEIYPDINCPDPYVLLLKMASWKLVSLAGVPELVKDDGVTMLREQSASAFEVRAEYYANPACEELRANGVLTVE